MDERSTLDSLLTPLKPYLAEAGAEVRVRPGFVFVKTKNGWDRHSCPELTFNKCLALAQVIGSKTGFNVDAKNPIFTGTLPDGERAHVVIPPRVPDGDVFISIRIFPEVDFTHADLIGKGVYSETHASYGCLDCPAEVRGRMKPVEQDLFALYEKGDWPAFMEAGVPAKLNYMMAGPTGSGKTALAIALSAFIPEYEHVLVIEGRHIEFRLDRWNMSRVLYDETGEGEYFMSAGAAVQSALRSDPDRVILSEVLGSAAYQYVEAALSAHPGSLATMHGRTPSDVVDRLVMLVFKSPEAAAFDQAFVRQLVEKSLDVIPIHDIRMGVDGWELRVTEIFYKPWAKYLG